MKWFLLLVSLLWIAVGSGYILYTRQFRQVMGNLIKGPMKKSLLVWRRCSASCSFLARLRPVIAGSLFCLGIIAIAKGVFIFLDPQGYWQKVKVWYLDRSLRAKPFDYSGL